MRDARRGRRRAILLQGQTFPFRWGCQIAQMLLLQLTLPLYTHTHTHGNKVRKMIYFFSAWPWETSFWGGFPRGGDSNGQKKLEDVRKCHRGHKTSIMSDTVFENYRKSLIRQCERSELRLHFEWTKVDEICPKSPLWRVFEKRSVIRQVTFNRTKLVENGKKKIKNATF